MLIVAVVVYHVTIVTSGHWMLKKFGHMVKGFVLGTAGSFLYLKLCRPATTELLLPGLEW